MARRGSLLLLIFAVLALASCERAQRFTAVAKKPASKTEANDEERSLYRLSWGELQERRDLPIIFVPETSAEWAALKTYWNEPSSTHGMATAHIGLPPLQALAAVVLTEHHLAIKIKVPRGLPDPTPNIPRSNAPTYGKWKLGQALFHESLLDAQNGPHSCASCHKAKFGFAERDSKSIGGIVNTLGLVNVVYNRRQFWDGRVATLEETLVRSRDDERAVDRRRSDKALQHHNWGGFVRSLVAIKRYNEPFKLVFGVDEHPTQDTVAQALATYLRTILAGDSLYDRAEQIRRDKKANTLTAEHFLEPLKDEKLAALLNDDDKKKLTAGEMAAMLAQGNALFHGKAGCVQCHSGPLFTDYDFHNVGYVGPEGAPGPGEEVGRLAQTPIGHKEWRLNGAFRTPSLRNLVHTGPYFHNGTQFTLPEVVEFFDQKVLPTPHLARALKAGNDERRLGLTGEEKEALVMFLRALEGTPVDPMVLKAER